MKYGGVDIQIHAFLASALIRGEWSASCSGERARAIHWIGGWVGPRIGLDDVEERKILPLPGLESLPSTVQPVTLCSLRYIWYVEV
jgi:hypothetical protein